MINKDIINIFNNFKNIFQTICEMRGSRSAAQITDGVKRAIVFLPYLVKKKIFSFTFIYIAVPYVLLDLHMIYLEVTTMIKVKRI